MVQSPLNWHLTKSIPGLDIILTKLVVTVFVHGRAVYVQYANGKKQAHQNLFFLHFYPRVEEGSTVNVPHKNLRAASGGYC